MITVYLARTSEAAYLAGVYPAERRAEIEATANEQLRGQRLCVWKLLERAVSECLGVHMRDLSVFKAPNGKWACDSFYFSLSHSADCVTVALSDQPVGVDIEGVQQFYARCEKSPAYIKSLADEIACDGERAESADELLKLWTGKEAIYKRADEGAFLPKKILIKNYPVRYALIEGVCVAVCGAGEVQLLKCEWLNGAYSRGNLLLTVK